MEALRDTSTAEKDSLEGKLKSEKERSTKELKALQDEKHSVEGTLKSAEEENARVCGECKGLQVSLATLEASISRGKRERK